MLASITEASAPYFYKFYNRELFDNHVSQIAKIELYTVYTSSISILIRQGAHSLNREESCQKKCLAAQKSSTWIEFSQSTASNSRKTSCQKADDIQNTDFEKADVFLQILLLQPLIASQRTP